MNIKANGRTALIVATGLFVCLAAPSKAEPSSANAAAASNSDSDAGAPIALNKYTKHAAHHAKNDAHRKSGKVAAKGSDTDKAGARDTADADNGGSATAIPPSVANANAQLTPADTPASSARAMTDRANNMLQAAPDNPPGAQPAADPQVVSADQLNDVDRALHETPPPATAAPAIVAPATMAPARVDAPAAAPATTATARRESSTWDQTSLIGKIFIGFGTLLTMASAARMFMA
jgi:hypothetical protein